MLEAHNGYLQIYLDLGLIGLFLLCTFLIATYRKICKQLKPVTPLGSLSLGLWTLLLFYNVSEAAFGGGLLWFHPPDGKPYSPPTRQGSSAPPDAHGPRRDATAY